MLRSLPALVVQTLFVGFLFAATDTLILQWSSRAVVPPLLLVGFLLSGALFTIVAALAAAPALALHRLVAARRPSESLLRIHFAVAFGGLLIFYHAARLRLEEVQVWEPAGLAAIVLVVGGIGLLLLPHLRGSAAPADGLRLPSPAELARAHLLIGVTAILWLAHLRDDAVTALFAGPLAGALLAMAVPEVSWRIARIAFPPSRASALGRLAAGTASLPLLWAGIAGATYPLFPGVTGPMPLASRPDTPAPLGQPNVLLLVLDTVRADHLSVYGYEKPTSPALARLAREASTFDRAISNSNWSLPSHASLLTGLLPHEHGAHTVVSAIVPDAVGERARINHRPLDERWETIAERLRDTGYRTAASVANYSWFAPEWGLLQGFELADNRRRVKLAWEPFCLPFLRRAGIATLSDLYAYHETSRYPADEIIAHALEWLDGLANDEPFFLLLNFMDAHSPYTSALYAAQIDEVAGRFDGESWPAENLRRYDLSIAFLDHELGRLFEALRARSSFDETLIVVTSDHGETFAAEGRGWHGADLRPSDIHIPLMVKLPGQREGERIDRLAQTVDVVPTILEAVGLPQPRGLHGSPLARSSRPVIAESYFAMGGTLEPGDEIAREDLDRVLPTLWALIEPDRKVIVGSDGRLELFDLRADPSESRSLARERPDLATEARDRLATLLPPGTFEHYALPVDAPEISAETLERLKSLGYAQ